MSPFEGGFEGLVARVLGDPAAEQALLEQHGLCAAVLVLGFSDSARRLAHEGPAYALALARAAEQRFALALEIHPERLYRRLRDGLLLVFTTPEAAVEAALDGLAAVAEFNRDRRGHAGDGCRSEPIGAGIGLGFGDLLLEPGVDAVGVEVNRALHLAGAATPGEVLATESFLAALGAPPVGIGSHRARADRVAAVGLPFFVLRDYRS